jgi:UDPglucose 6-dehydrogenase
LNPGELSGGRQAGHPRRRSIGRAGADQPRDFNPGDAEVKITIIGSGYVGLVSGACFADLGNDVVCVDVDEKKIAQLRGGTIPIYEPGLQQLVSHNVAAGRLRFTTDVDESVTHGAVQFIAVGTPSDQDGSADMRYVIAAARSIGRSMPEYRVVVNKSTVPVGTSERVRAAIAEELKKRGVDLEFSVVSNPEFLKEGAAVDDFMRPDRIVVGSSDERATQIMRQLYAPLSRNHDRIFVMDPRSAELTKYAANAMLATRISFMNELANLAEKLGANIESVRQGIGSDQRIGYHFLYAGVGYGGSCFPKDIQALQHTAGEYGVQMTIVDSVEKANRTQKQRLLEKVRGRFGEQLDGRHFAVWGLSFKPNTDDMREAPSRVVINGLLARGPALPPTTPLRWTKANVYLPRNPASASRHQR